MTAFKECIETYGSMVWALALRGCSSRTDAEDFVQDVYLELWKSSWTYSSEKGSGATYVGVVTRRRLIDRLRKRECRPQYDSSDRAQAVLGAWSHCEHPSNLILARRALAVLSPVRRRIIVMSVVAGMSHGEISASTSIPIGTVKSHIRRGLMAARRFLGIE